MAAEDSQEAIDFDFFDEGDNRSKSYTGEKSPAAGKSRDIGQHSSSTTATSRPSSGRPDSVRSTTSSLSIKIPTGGTPRERKPRYSSDEEDDYSPKDVNGFDKYDQKKDRSRSDSGGSSSGGPSKSTRSKDRHSSGSSSASYSSSLDSKSGNSDDDSSNSSDSVTDVSPMQSPDNSRSPSPPRLQYNHDEMDSSPERNSKKFAKDSVRFKEPSARGGCVRPPPGSKKTGQLDESEAQELSMLLRAVLEMEETPQRSEFHDFDPPRLHRPLSGKRPMSGKSKPHQRMNMSFSNDEVRRIDRDNQRLLQNIMDPPSSVPKPAQKKRTNSGRMRTRSASFGSIHSRPASGHISHSALLRQKDQRRIEMENMKILQRIESAKPTSELQSNKLKKDFSKQQQYSAQVSKAPGRPLSAKRPSSAKSPGTRGMNRASSLQSLRSDFSHTSSSTATSSRIRSRPSSAKYGPGMPDSRPSWDDHFAYY